MQLFMPSTPSVATYKTIGPLGHPIRKTFAISDFFRLFMDRMSFRAHKNRLLSATIRALGSFARAIAPACSDTGFQYDV